MKDTNIEWKNENSILLFLHNIDYNFHSEIYLEYYTFHRKLFNISFNPIHISNIKFLPTFKF